MESAKDFGFNEGYALDKGSIAPADHTVVSGINENKSLAIPTAILDNEHTSYTKAAGLSTPVNPDVFGKSYVQSRNILNATGITKSPTPQDTEIGVDFNGDKIYSSPQLANNPDATHGQKIAQDSGIALGAMGAFSDFKEAQKFITIGDHAADTNFHKTLDGFKTSNDPKGFISSLGKVTNGIDKSSTGYTAYKLYENWNNLSPAQKSIGITGIGMQGYTFGDGKTFTDKKLTKEIPNTPSLSASEGLDFASRGINMSPVTKKWSQLSVIQDTLYSPKSGGDTVNTSNELGLLGFDLDGKAVPMSREKMGSLNLSPAPHYGIGAATVPAGKGVPSGYEKIGNSGGQDIVIPSANKSSAHLNTPDIASDNSVNIYSNWKQDADTKQDRGVAGGSALAGGLHGMTNSNPYSLGAVLTNATFGNLPDHQDHTDLEHTTHMAGVSLHRLVAGEATKDTDSKGVDLRVSGNFDEDSYNKAMKATRGEYSKQGISSKEIGYQLANQGYAEGRFDESQVVAAHKSLDMVFDENSYSLAQKLATGKNKGKEIMEKRRG